MRKLIVLVLIWNISGFVVLGTMAKGDDFRSASAANADGVAAAIVDRAYATASVRQPPPGDDIFTGE